MAVAEDKSRGNSERKVGGLFKMSFWQKSGGGTSSASSTQTSVQNTSSQSAVGSVGIYAEGINCEPQRRPELQPVKKKSVLSSVAKSILPVRRRLRLDPANKLYFPCELVYPSVLLFSSCVSGTFKSNCHLIV